MDGLTEGSMIELQKLREELVEKRKALQRKIVVARAEISECNRRIHAIGLLSDDLLTTALAPEASIPTHIRAAMKRFDRPATIAEIADNMVQNGFLYDPDSRRTLTEMIGQELGRMKQRPNDPTRSVRRGVYSLDCEEKPLDTKTVVA